MVKYLNHLKRYLLQQIYNSLLVYRLLLKGKDKKYYNILLIFLSLL